VVTVAGVDHPVMHPLMLASGSRLQPAGLAPFAGADRARSLGDSGPRVPLHLTTILSLSLSQNKKTAFQAIHLQLFCPFRMALSLYTFAQSGTVLINIRTIRILLLIEAGQILQLKREQT
jgi:hypothetical protein